MIRALLVIEDDRSEREALTELLRRAGYVVFAAADAPHARDVLGTMKPRAIVTDLSIPGESGAELIVSIRSDARFRRVPIVAITGDVHATMPAGAQHFLRKPVRPRELLDVVALASR